MNSNQTDLERAFELAKSGKYGNVSNIKSALLAERCSTEKVTGASLSKQLLDLLAAKEIAQATRHKRSVGVIMLDIDHFRQFNDLHGH